jgi:hypothetical protein
MDGGVSDTIVKGIHGHHPRAIPAMFGMTWFSSFREEDLNMKVYDDGRPIDTK